jgi:hypothetical protein
LNSNSNDEASEHRTELDPPVTESNLPVTSSTLSDASIIIQLDRLLVHDYDAERAGLDEG